MVENRRYSDFELTYVLSRILANWKPELIAKAFKRDHAPYWDDKVFTKKQVSYIKNTYKGPPGSIQPYTGPMPEFGPSPPRSPDKEASSRPKMDCDGNKSGALTHGESVEELLNMMGTQEQQETAQATNFMTETGADDNTGGAQVYPIDELLYMFDEPDPPFQTFQDYDNEISQILRDCDAPLPFAKDVQSDQTQDDTFRKGPDCSSPSDVWFNPTDSPLDTPSFMLNDSKYGIDNGVVQLPAGFTHHNFVAQDEYGWKYSGAHDNCAIACAHRHEAGGGVFFNDYGTLTAWVRAYQHGGHVLLQNNNDVTSKDVSSYGDTSNGLALKGSPSNGAALQDSLLAAPYTLGAPAVDINQMLPAPSVPAQSKLLADTADINKQQQLLGAYMSAQGQVLAAPAYAGNAYQSNGYAASFNSGLLQQNQGFASAYGQQGLLDQKPVMNQYYGMIKADPAPLDPSMSQLGGLSQPQPDWWARDVWKTAVADGNMDSQLIARQTAWQNQNTMQQPQRTTPAAPVAMARGAGAVYQQGVAGAAPKMTAAGAPRHTATRVNKKAGASTKRSSPPYSSDDSGNGGRRRQRRAVDSDDDFDFKNPAV